MTQNGKSVAVVLVLCLLLAALVAVGLNAKAEQQRRARQQPAGAEPIKLHACQPSPAKVEEERRLGRRIVDAKCDERGGIYILTAPAEKKQ